MEIFENPIPPEVCPEDFSKVVEKLKSTEPTPYIRKRCICNEVKVIDFNCPSYSHCTTLINRAGNSAFENQLKYD